MSNRRGRWNGNRFRGRGRQKSTKAPPANPTRNFAHQDDSAGTDNDSSDSDLNPMGRRLSCPYHGWKLYFDEKEYIKGSPLIKKIEASQGFLERCIDPITMKSLDKGSVFSIDVITLYKDAQFMEEWENFRDHLRMNPSESLSCLGLAVHQTIVETLLQEDSEYSTKKSTNLPLIRVRIFNYHPNVPFKDLRVDYYGTLISTRGCVIRVDRPLELCLWMAFACVKCKLERFERQPDGLLATPLTCDTCGATKFLPKLNSPHIITVPFQTIRLQEKLGEDLFQNDQGRMPRILEVELMSDLVDSCMPGDDVTVVGIIKARGADDGKGAAKKKMVTGVPLYMDAVSVANNKCKTQSKTALDVELDIQDYISINNIHKREDIFALLIRSLSPSIFAQDIVKAGLLLSLFGGSAKHASLRDDIHVLMVGDPGLGKSHMLQDCVRVAPKGVYVCGNTSTCSGLTVSLTKEAGTNDFALEPGALVLADRGCCLIDEFDKMQTQHQALLEAMEQQSVSVAKSGVICSFPARTSILAAANPIGGRYDRSKSVIKNLNMSEPLLSRFDLIFLMLDIRDPHRDSRMCAHVLKNSKQRGIKYNSKESMTSQSAEIITANIPTKTATLKERLSLFNPEPEDLISHTVMRKYIAYARQYVHPTLSPDAGRVLQDYYIKLRERSNIFGSIPVFNRQLEALIRMTEARAKIELRTDATETDALDVVEIMQYTLADIPPSSGPLAPSSSTGKLTNNKVKSFINLLRDDAVEEVEKLYSKADLMRFAERVGVNVQDFNSFIRKLNEEGILLNKGKQLYKFFEG